jgi:hypothetical protein
MEVRQKASLNSSSRGREGSTSRPSQAYYRALPPQRNYNRGPTPMELGMVQRERERDQRDQRNKPRNQPRNQPAAQPDARRRAQQATATTCGRHRAQPPHAARLVFPLPQDGPPGSPVPCKVAGRAGKRDAPRVVEAPAEEQGNADSEHRDASLATEYHLTQDPLSQRGLD